MKWSASSFLSQLLYLAEELYLENKEAVGSNLLIYARIITLTTRINVRIDKVRSGQLDAGLKGSLGVIRGLRQNAC